MPRRKPKPLFTEVEIIDAGAKGKAIAKAPDGRVIFVQNAVPGDIADIQTFKKRKAYYEGKATSFKKYSEKRTTPKCKYFGICGGCKWQHMKYEHQLFYKEKEVQDNLVRIGKLDLPTISPIIGCNENFHYRNKMEFSFSDSRWLTEEEVNSGVEIVDRQALGFHIPGMWDKILDIDECWLQAEPSNAIRNEIKRFAVDHKLSFFNPRERKGLLRTLMIRNSSIGEWMVLIQFHDDQPEKREGLLDHLKNRFPEITSLLYVINQKANDTIYDQEVICYHGRDHIMEEIDDLEFKINAKSFYQTNSEQAKVLYSVTREFAGLSGNELVYDLYTGTGTIAQFVAAKAQKVVGIESVPEAIEAARENAQLNNISNVSFFAGDMKTIFNDEFIKTNGIPDVIITDPPRDGMHKKVVQQILDIGPKKIVYVSCNSATQARDLSLMREKYKVVKVQPVDMFPHTHHVENVVLLEKI